MKRGRRWYAPAVVGRHRRHGAVPKATKGRIQDAHLRGLRPPLPRPPARHTRRARPPPTVLEISQQSRPPPSGAIRYTTRRKPSFASADARPPTQPCEHRRRRPPLAWPQGGNRAATGCRPHSQSQEPRRADGVANCRASRHRRPETGRRQEPRPAQPKDGNAPQVLTKFQSRGPTTGPALLAQPFRTCRATSRTELRI